MCHKIQHSLSTIQRIISKYLSMIGHVQVASTGQYNPVLGVAKTILTHDPTVKSLAASQFCVSKAPSFLRLCWQALSAASYPWSPLVTVCRHFLRAVKHRPNSCHGNARWNAGQIQQTQEKHRLRSVQHMF